MPANSNQFSHKHPFVFGILVLTAAVALFIGAMAVFRALVLGGGALESQERFGLVWVEDVIYDSYDVCAFIAELRDDPLVRGVVLRVDSPGGGVGPSQEIHRAVQKLARVKPVVVSMGSMAASGGYYISCPAHRILANPGTITGSIGVIMQLTDLRELMKTLGIGHEAMVSGRFKNTGTPYEELTDEEREYLTALVMDLYDQFVLDVAEGRRLSPETVRELADGRVYTGRQALELKLIDELGGLEEAFEVLAELTGMPVDLPVQDGPEEEVPLLWDILGVENPVPPVRQMLNPRKQLFQY